MCYLAFNKCCLSAKYPIPQINKDNRTVPIWNGQNCEAAASNWSSALFSQFVHKMNYKRKIWQGLVHLLVPAFFSPVSSSRILCTVKRIIFLRVGPATNTNTISNIPKFMYTWHEFEQTVTEWCSRAAACNKSKPIRIVDRSENSIQVTSSNPSSNFLVYHNLWSCKSRSLLFPNLNVADTNVKR